MDEDVWIRRNLKLTEEQTRFQRSTTDDDYVRSRISGLMESSQVNRGNKNTGWGINTFDAWRQWRNESVAEPGQESIEKFTRVPPLNSHLNGEELNFWLTRFIIEVSWYRIFWCKLSRYQNFLSVSTHSCKCNGHIIILVCQSLQL